MKKKQTITAPERNSHDPRWNELGKYFRYLADCMGLGQWSFTISHDKPGTINSDDEESWASIFIASQSVTATLHVSDSFWTTELYHQRWLLVHELVHVVEAPFMKALEKMLESVDSVSAGAIINQLSERFVDQISLMLAPRWSMPPKNFTPRKGKGVKKHANH